MHIFCFAFLTQAKYDITAPFQGRHIAKTHIWSKKPYTIFMYYYNPYMYLHSCEIAHYLLYSNCSIKWFEDDGQICNTRVSIGKKRPFLDSSPVYYSVFKNQNGLWMVAKVTCGIYLHIPKDQTKIHYKLTTGELIQ